MQCACSNCCINSAGGLTSRDEYSTEALLSFCGACPAALLDVVVAGALEGLVSTAHLHLKLGVASPFLVRLHFPSSSLPCPFYFLQYMHPKHALFNFLQGTPRPHTAPLPSLISSLRHIGRAISKDGTPQSMGPFIIVVTG